MEEEHRRNALAEPQPKHLVIQVIGDGDRGGDGDGDGDGDGGGDGDGVNCYGFVAAETEADGGLILSP